jgi:hypothetical protein
MRSSAALVVAVCLLGPQVPAWQTATAPIELRLRAEKIVAGVPQEFEFQIVNRTDHDVRLPEPLTTCDDSHKGKLRLLVSFSPLSPPMPPPSNGKAGAPTIICSQ